MIVHVLNSNRSACRIVPSRLISGSTLGRVQHHVLVHIDQAWCHRFARRIDDERTLHLDGISRDLSDDVTLDEHIGILDQIRAKPVEDIYIGEEYRDCLFFF